MELKCAAGVSEELPTPRAQGEQPALALRGLDAGRAEAGMDYTVRAHAQKISHTRICFELKAKQVVRVWLCCVTYLNRMFCYCDVSDEIECDVIK